MGVISHPSNFFGNSAAQHGGAHPDDKLEEAILSSQQKDAALVRRSLNWLAHWLTQPEDRADDPMEQAILACQRRDAAIVRHLLTN